MPKKKVAISLAKGTKQDNSKDDTHQALTEKGGEKLITEKPIKKITGIKPNVEVQTKTKNKKDTAISNKRKAQDEIEKPISKKSKKNEDAESNENIDKISKIYDFNMVVNYCGW